MKPRRDYRDDGAVKRAGEHYPQKGKDPGFSLLGDLDYEGSRLEGFGVFCFPCKTHRLHQSIAVQIVDKRTATPQPRLMVILRSGSTRAAVADWEEIVPTEPRQLAPQRQIDSARKFPSNRH